jgi:hypothetical protein
MSVANVVNWGQLPLCCLQCAQLCSADIIPFSTLQCVTKLDYFVKLVVIW